MTKSRRIRREAQVGRTWLLRNAFESVTLEGRGYLEDIAVDGNIKLDLKVIECNSGG
jgi:hypothetical protein